MKDPRYTIKLEHCGNGVTRYVLRFNGGKVADAISLPEARVKMAQHKYYFVRKK